MFACLSLVWKTRKEWKGAFTPDANEALRVNDLHVKSMQRRVNYAARIERLGRLTRELKNLNFGGYSRRVNQSGACSSSAVTSGGRQSESTMEDKLIVVVCGYPELYDTTSYFYKNRNTFCNETGAAWLKPPHDANSHLLCSEFHARMKRVKSKCSSVQLRVNSATYSLHSRLV